MIKLDKDNNSNCEKCGVKIPYEKMILTKAYFEDSRSFEREERFLCKECHWPYSREYWDLNREKGKEKEK